MRPRLDWIVLLLTLGAVPACLPAESADSGDDPGEDGGDSDDGDSGDGDDGNDGDDEPRFHLVDLVDTDDGVQRLGVDTVNGIRCADATHCAIATRNFGDGGALFVTADGTALEPVMTTRERLGGAQFLGIDDTGQGWIARIDRAGPFVIAAGDPSAAASWSLVAVGASDSGSDFTELNSQELVRAGSGGDWLYVYSGIAWHAATAPGETTAWSGQWSPGRLPPFPADYDARKEADATLCDSDPAVAIEPDMTHLGFASADLGAILFPAGGRNQPGTDPPGVCVSHDRGVTFHQVAFPDLRAGEIGPLAVACLDADRCWAFGGVDFDGGPAYVYRSSDASAAAPTWQRGAVPSQADSDQPRAISFAPDALHGWLVGDDGLIWRTDDGGATWADAAGELAAVAGMVDWTSVFAVAPDRVWLGGADGVLVTGRP